MTLAAKLSKCFKKVFGRGLFPPKMHRMYIATVRSNPIKFILLPKLYDLDRLKYWRYRLLEHGVYAKEQTNCVLRSCNFSQHVFIAERH